MTRPLWDNPGRAYANALPAKCDIKECDGTPIKNVLIVTTGVYMNVCKVHYHKYLEEQKTAISKQS